MNWLFSKLILKNKQESYISSQTSFKELTIPNIKVLFCYLHMCIFLESSVIFLSNNEEYLNAMCNLLSEMFPIDKNLFAVNTIQLLNSKNKTYGIEIKNLNKVNLPEDKKRVFISKFNSINDYKNSEINLYNSNSSYSFIKYTSDPDLFIKTAINKLSVLNSINKLSSLIFLYDTNFDIFEFSWLSNADITIGNSINDLDMYTVKKLLYSSDNFINNSSILEKYARRRGINKEYCTAYFKKIIKTNLFNHKAFWFNSFLDI